MTIVICDHCKQQIVGGIWKSGALDGGDYHFECLEALTAAAAECQHEDNVSDAVPGRDTARLICKACGYDRIETVGG